MNSPRWFADWRVWLCLAIVTLVWIVTFPLRLLDWLLSIFR